MQNILLDSNFNVKVADFGLSHIKQEIMSQPAGRSLQGGSVDDKQDSNREKSDSKDKDGDREKHIRQLSSGMASKGE